MALLGLPELLGRNFDDVGAAGAEVEPLVADGAVDANLDHVGERTALPAVFVGGESEDVVCETRRLKCAGAEQALIAAGIRVGKSDEVGVAGEQRGQHRHRRIAGEHHRTS